MPLLFPSSWTVGKGQMLGRGFACLRETLSPRPRLSYLCIGEKTDIVAPGSLDVGTSYWEGLAVDQWPSVWVLGARGKLQARDVCRKLS